VFATDVTAACLYWTTPRERLYETLTYHYGTHPFHNRIL